MKPKQDIPETDNVELIYGVKVKEKQLVSRWLDEDSNEVPLVVKTEHPFKE